MNPEEKEFWKQNRTAKNGELNQDKEKPKTKKSIKAQDKLEELNETKTTNDKIEATKFCYNNLCCWHSAKRGEPIYLKELGKTTKGFCEKCWNLETGKTFICCLCHKQFKGFGNNPEPLKSAPNRCCDECDRNKVIPARLKNVKWRVS